MSTPKNFAARFEGESNAGLRAVLRKTAKSARRDGRDVAQALRGVGAVIALTASGRHTLEQVIADYAGLPTTMRARSDDGAP